MWRLRNWPISNRLELTLAAFRPKIPWWLASSLPMELHSVGLHRTRLYRTQESCHVQSAALCAQERDRGSPGTLVAGDLREVHRDDFWELHRRLGESLSWTDVHSLAQLYQLLLWESKQALRGKYCQDTKITCWSRAYSLGISSCQGACGQIPHVGVEIEQPSWNLDNSWNYHLVI